MSGLDLPDDGRGAAIVDWDRDGDLDVWLVNRSGPQLRFMRNEQSRSGVHFLALKLEGRHSNRDAIGARVELKMEGDATSQIQTVRAGDAYLAQSSKWLHFGTGADDQIEFVKVRWPGQRNEQVYTDLLIDRRYKLTQGETSVDESTPQPAEDLAINPKGIDDDSSPRGQRVLLTTPVPLPPLNFRLVGEEGQDLTSQDDRPATTGLGQRGAPTLINLWATWCQPCLRELAEFSRRYEDLRAAGISIVALSVDEVDLSRAADAVSVNAAVRAAQANFPFEVGQADENLLDQLQIAHDNLLDLHQPFPIPSSVLLDQDGRLMAIYKGPLDVNQLIGDVRSLGRSPPQRRESALPFPGRWSAAPRSPRLLKLASDMLDRGYLEAAEYYPRHHEAELAEDSEYAILLFNLGQQYTRRGEHQAAVAFYKRALQQRPALAPAYYNLGVTYAGTGQFDAALVCFEHADKHEPNQIDTRLALARTLIQLDRATEAVDILIATARLHPDNLAVRQELQRLRRSHSNQNGD